MTQHKPIILTGPPRPTYDGGQRMTWQASCVCGWSSELAYPHLERANRSFKRHYEAENAA